MTTEGDPGRLSSQDKTEEEASRSYDCPECGGTGEVDGEGCLNCGGTGKALTEFS